MSTTRLVYVGPRRPGVTIEPPRRPQIVAPYGEAVEVPDDLVDGLVATGRFERVDPPRRPTVEEVLADVGDDPDRAAAALAAEQAADRPRRSLIDRLEQIATPTS